MQHIQGVIFDLDGTLVSSALNFKWLREQINCPPEEDILAFIDTLTDLSLRHQAHHIIEQHELDDAHSATWLPGAKNLVD